jgi:4-hydroxy-tetrahydrodipicolinate synthase
MDRLSGAFAPVPTPLTENDRFDQEALRRHLTWLAEHGLDGALILGTNGEFPSFSLAERLQIAEAAAGCDPGLKLLLGIGSCSLLEVLEMLAAATRHGYSGVLCPPPFYFRNAPLAGFANFLRKVLEAAEIPVLLYHIPQATGVPISDELLLAIGEHEALAGVKDSSADLDELQRLQSRFCNGVYLVGHDRLVTTCHRAGGQGSITAAASIAPALVKAAATDASQQLRLDQVRAVLDELGLGPTVKAVLRQKRFGAYSTRPPLVGLARDREEELIRRLQQLGLEI